MSLAAYYLHGVVERLRDPSIERNFHTLPRLRALAREWSRRRPMRLDEFAAELSSKRPRPGVLVTLDDGYANNMLAAEVFAAARVPWTLFLSTGEIGPRGCLWTSELSLLLLHGRARLLEGDGWSLPLRTRADRVEAYRALRWILKRRSAADRRDALDSIRCQFPSGETERLLGEFPSMRMLDWKQVRELARSGVGLGGHGVRHELHHDAQSAAVRRAELQGCREDLRSRAGVEASAFAYPNGDFIGSSPREVARAGFSLAFTTQKGACTRKSDPFLLPRIEAAPGHFI